MGIIIGKFGRKKKSTYEILEKLDSEIKDIEEFGRSTEQMRKKIVGRFILLAILIYIILALCLYLYYNQISDNQKFIYIIPLIAIPFVIFGIKKILTWYYTRKLRKNEKKLIKLKEDKKKILDNVMETETYKVAKQILDKFANDFHKNPQNFTDSVKSKLVPSSIKSAVVPGLRQRTVGPPAVRSRLSFGNTDSPQPLPRSNVPQISMTPSTPMVRNQQIARTPLPVIPKERSVLDKMIDYLLDDGPSNRYAMICKKCSGHNGMALKSEFEYQAFNCYYCLHHNPARKKRPTGPTFENVSPSRTITDNLSDSSESEKEEIKQNVEDSTILSDEVLDTAASGDLAGDIQQENILPLIDNSTDVLETNNPEFLDVDGPQADTPTPDAS